MSDQPTMDLVSYDDAVARYCRDKSLIGEGAILAASG